MILNTTLDPNILKKGVEKINLTLFRNFLPDILYSGILLVFDGQHKIKNLLIDYILELEKEKSDSELKILTEEIIKKKIQEVDATYNGDIEDFYSNVKKKNIPLEAIIVPAGEKDKKKNFFPIDNCDNLKKVLNFWRGSSFVIAKKKHEDKDPWKYERSEILESGSRRHSVTLFQDNVFRTFWPSDEINFLCKEFADEVSHIINSIKSSSDSEKNKANKNMKIIKNGIEIIFEVIEQIRLLDIHKKKIRINVWTAPPKKTKYIVDNYDPKKTPLYKLLENHIEGYFGKYVKNYDFKVKILNWNPESEDPRKGRDIYSKDNIIRTSLIPFKLTSVTGNPQNYEYLYLENGGKNNITEEVKNMIRKTTDN